VTYVARWIRSASLVLIAVMVLMPPLVRATQPLTGNPASQIRLNRGFDRPETRCDVTPGLTQPVVATISAGGLDPSQILAPYSNDEPVPCTPAHLPFDSLRGPPSVLIA
jgi:hypothetical protein